MASVLNNSLSTISLTVAQLRKQFFTGARNFASYNNFKNRRDFKPPVKRKVRVPRFETLVKLAPKLDKRPKQNFDYFLVLDFEATCNSPNNLDSQEIIEFPVLKVNSDTFEIESTFHHYVRPVIYPELTSFCTELTGVIQSMVDNQPVFKEVYENFLKWLSSENLTKPDVKFAFVTCGDADLDFLFPMQCSLSEIEVPEYMKQWINVKRSFCEISPYTWPRNLSAMMEICELENTGDLHSGIDDSKNVVKIMANLADRGLVFNINGWKKNK